MKKLTGMKNFSSLENKKLNDLKIVQGGLYNSGSYNVQSNVSVGEGCTEYDTYTSPGGTYIGRITVCDPT